MSAKTTSAASRSAAVAPPSSFVDSRCCSLPLWDDSQIAQENWGASLAYSPAIGGDEMGKDSRQGAGKSKSITAGKHGAATSATEVHFEDPATRQGVEAFITAQEPSLASTNTTEEVQEGGSPSGILWLKPTEVFRPFRPVVHCNATPFINPYATAEALVPVDAKAEEARCHHPTSASMTANNSSTHHKGGNVSQQSDTSSSMPDAFHQLYPEAVTTLDVFSYEERERWSHCTQTESVRRYRALPTLLQPYDGTLIAGCAETPAQACESRYSTGLRHKLKQAEQLAALAQTPPFLMRAFNSALLVVEQAQCHVPEGWYLWELVYPHAPGTCHPVYNPYGKYAVKLFVDGAYRKVLVDDSLPVDVLGRPLLTTTSLKELWPCLIAKAVLKALGPISGLTALTSAPQLVVATLLGNWVPQYILPKHDSVSATAMLLLYQRQLAQMECLTEPFLKERPTTATGPRKPESAGEGRAKDSKGSTRDRQTSPIASPSKRTVPIATRNAAGKRQQGTHSSSASGDAAEKGPDLVPLRATEYCEPVIDEPFPDENFYICSLYTPSADAVVGESVQNGLHGHDVARQLYTIHAIKPFRNTVALLLHTTPRGGLSEGILKEDGAADDVSALHDWGRRSAQGRLHPGSSPKQPHPLEDSEPLDISFPRDATSVTDMVIIDSRRASSVTSCWLTLEEFVVQMETVIVWRKLTGRYPNAVFVSGESLLQLHDGGVVPIGAKSTDSTPSAGARKKASPARRADASSNNTAASNISTQHHAPSVSSIWWRLTVEKAEEVFVVVSCPAQVEDLGNAPLPVKGPSSRSPSPAHPSQSNEMRESIVNTRRSKDAIVVNQQREVFFRHFQWDRGEPLNDIGSLTYTQGVLRSTALHFRPGVHLIRVDLHHVQAPDKISFLSNAASEVQLALSHDASHDGFACVTDAGTYPAVQSCDEEIVWLKRVFSLTAPTCLTVQLTTLDATEDLAAHRQINTISNRSSATASGAKGSSNHTKAAASGKATSQGGGASPGAAKASGVSPMQGATAGDGKKRCDNSISADAKDITSSTAASVEASAPLLRFTWLLLVDLDRPEDYSVGVAGRIVTLQLKPNEKGYLLMAYTLVPAHQLRSVQQSEKAVEDKRQVLSWPQKESSPEKGNQEPGQTPLEEPSCSETYSMEPPPLFPAGRWKLVLRSNVDLQAFDSVSHDVQSTTIEAELQRGVSPILFRRICTISEVTHISIMAHLRAPLPMPYKIRIIRLPSSAPSAPTPSNPRAARMMTNNTTIQGIPETNAADSISPNGAASSRGSTMVVYESPMSDSRLFAPNVFLATAVEPYTGKGSKGASAAGTLGGGATLYVIEAVVSDEDAARWNECCRKSQEEMFIEYRQAAEEKACIAREQDIAEYKRDPVAYMQRKEEVSAQRRQLATEAAEKAMSRTAPAGGSIAGLRKRSASSSRTSPQSLLQLDASLKDSFRCHSSSVQPDLTDEVPAEYVLDTPNPDWAVHITVHLSLSSSRAEVKPDAPAPDALVELRKRMKETVSWLQDFSESRSFAGETTATAPTIPSVSAASSGGKSAAQRAQRDAAAAAAATMEDALHAEAARQSRSEYLRNPQHIFFPLGSASDSAETGGFSGIAPSSSLLHRSKHDANFNGSGTGTLHTATSGVAGLSRNSRKESAGTSVGTVSGSLDDQIAALYMGDSAAKNLRYALPLQPPQYSIELLPLRCWEECAPVAPQGKDGAAGIGAAAPVVSTRGKRSKGLGGSTVITPSSNRTHNSTPGASNGSSTVAPSATGISTLCCPLTSADREEMILPLSRPLIEASESWDLAVTQARQAKAENNSRLKNTFHAFFVSMLEKKALKNGEATAAASPIVFHSLLGSKDEETTTILKPKKSFAFL